MVGSATARELRTCKGGFSLIEVVMVVAIVAILAGTVTSLVGSEMDEARISRAEADVEGIADAIDDFYRTVGNWPSMDNTGAMDRLWTLITGYAIPGSNPYTQSHAFWTWASSASGDLLGNHLVVNSPKGQQVQRYPTSGRYKWRGPYLDAATLDPWSRPYVINVIAGHSTHATSYRRLWVLSAGPDGAFQTSANATISDDIAGDDIGFLMAQR